MPCLTTRLAIAFPALEDPAIRIFADQLSLRMSQWGSATWWGKVDIRIGWRLFCMMGCVICQTSRDGRRSGDRRVLPLASYLGQLGRPLCQMLGWHRMAWAWLSSRLIISPPYGIM